MKTAQQGVFIYDKNLSEQGKVMQKDAAKCAAVMKRKEKR